MPAAAMLWCAVYVALLAYEQLAGLTPSFATYAVPQLGIWAILGFSLWAGARAATDDGRRGWRWMALSQLVSALVTVRRPLELLLFDRLVSPDWIGGFVILQVPCLWIGCRLLGGAPVRTSVRRELPSDVATIIVAAMGLFLAFGLWPTLQSSADHSWYGALSLLAAPLGWLTAIVGTYGALRRPLTPTRRFALTLLLLSFFGRFTADTILVSTYDANHMVGRGMLRAVWVSALALQLLAPWVDARPVWRVPAWVEHGVSVRLTTLVAALLAGVAIYMTDSNAYPARTMPLAIGVVLMTALVILRQGQTERTLDRARATEARDEVQTKQLESMERAATSTAHDFGNLLMLVDVNATMLRSVPMPSDAQQLVEEIGEATARGVVLSRRLMRAGATGEADTGLMPLDARLRELSPLLRRMLPPEIHLEIELHAPDARVRADDVQLDQIVMNLVWNARDAMPTGGVLDVATSTIVDAAGERVLLTVRDSGVGMTAETQARIFERYFTTKAEQAGHGVGLATVHDIVVELGGAVQVESAPGEGSSFIVALPIRHEADMLDADAHLIAAPRPH